MPIKTKTSKCDVSQLKPGTRWSRHSYGTVVGVDTINQAVMIRNEAGDEWSIDAALVQAEFYTADQFEKVEELTRTQMVELILGNPRIVMTINFNKKADPKDLKDYVATLLEEVKKGGKVPGPRKLSGELKKATAGAERTMVGRHSGTTDDFGRLNFTDVENLASNGGLRQVDPRTVNWCIIAGVKYILK